MSENRYLEPESSPLFTPWTDPKSGVTSFLLTRRAAPWQQAFYFTNANISNDGRWLWFYAAFPPSPMHVLGVGDFREGTVRAFPETAFVAEAPWIDPDTGEAIWAVSQEVFRRGPMPEDAVRKVGGVPAFRGVGPRDVQGVRRVTTHLTRSADGTRVNLDLVAGDAWHVGAMRLDTGEIELWASFGVCYKHAQFSPSDPTLMMLCQDWWNDIKTGVFHPYKNRIWLLREGEAAKPLFPEGSGKNVARHSHEWWAADGKGVWFVDYDRGTEFYDLETGEHTNVWPAGTCHSHASRDGRLLVGDIHTYEWKTRPVRIAFYNRDTGREVDIVAAMPQPPASPVSSYYHPHPHPQFVLQGEFICYTTTVRGTLDVALVRVADLVARSLGG